MTSRAPRFVVEAGNDRPTVRPLGILRDRPSDPDTPILEVVPLPVSELRDALRGRLRARATKPMPMRPKAVDPQATLPTAPPKTAAPSEKPEPSGVRVIAKTRRAPMTEELVVLSDHDLRLERT